MVDESNRQVLQDRATMLQYAGIVARLSHRMADRDAILHRAGLGDQTFAALEARALWLLAMDPSWGPVFASAFLASRRELLGLGGVAAVPPPTVQAHTRAVPTVPGSQPSPFAGAGPTAHGEPMSTERPVDPEDLMETLARGGEPNIEGMMSTLSSESPDKANDREGGTKAGG